MLVKPLDDIEVYDVRYLPIVKAYADKIGLVEVVNRFVPSEMDVKPGHMMLAMVLDTLTGRSPLYHLETFYKSEDIELLVGKGYSAKSFNDDSVGRHLDKFYEVGTMKLFSEIAVRAASIFALEKRYVHFDTTSLSVYGDYKPGLEDPFLITFGHSKDHRPDLKQLVFSMLCVDRGVPIMGKTEDGNASDKMVNNVILSELSCTMAKHGVGAGAYIYVADSALVTEINLRAMEKMLFVSRLPASYNECGRVITEAVSKNMWQEVGRIAKTQPTKNRPGASYKVYETKVILHGMTYRAVVVHSSAHDKRRQKGIDRELKEARKEVESSIRKETSIEYFCMPDAEAAAKRLSAINSPYYAIAIRIVEQPIYAPGRPKKGTPRKVKGTRYRLEGSVSEKADVVTKQREEAACFVLLSNVPEEGEAAHSGAQILKVYKEQHGIEQNFGFLKDPVIVNSLFLKKPHRIEALGLVLLLALLIWRLMEASMRKYVEETETKLTGLNNRPTDRPTSHMITRTFTSIMIIKTGHKRRLARPLSADQSNYLKALGVRAAVFTTPQPGG